MVWFREYQALECCPTYNFFLCFWAMKDMKWQILRMHLFNTWFFSYYSYYQCNSMLRTWLFGLYWLWPFRQWETAIVFLSNERYEMANSQNVRDQYLFFFVILILPINAMLRERDFLVFIDCDHSDNGKLPCCLKPNFP